MNRRTFVLAWLLLLSASTPSLWAQNGHVEVVMHRLQELKYTLPQGEFSWSFREFRG